MALFAPAPDALPLAAANHPLRAFLSEEMHIRKLPGLKAPARLLQYVLQSGEAGAGAGIAHIRRLCALNGQNPGVIGKYFTGEFGPFSLVFEAHTEFCTYLILAPGGTGPLAAAGLEPFFPADWIAALPGRVVQATHLAFLDRGTPDPDEAELAGYFSLRDLVACRLAGGKALLWSDYHLHEDGFGRLIVADRGLERTEPSELLQRLLEQGNYRNMALLGLPEAQRLSPDVSRLEERLATLTAAVAERQSHDDTLLEEVSYLSAQLARLMAETRYRMSASRAYAQLSTDRLASLDVGRIPGCQTLTDFSERRLVPATRTCDSFSHRLEDLSQRVAWTSALLRTRVETALERQNRDLLHSMNLRAELQLRLQHTVEGLSAVAISYYAVSLLSHLIEALHAVDQRIPADGLTGFLVVPVALIVWWGLRRVRRKLHPVSEVPP